MDTRSPDLELQRRLANAVEGLMSFAGSAAAAVSHETAYSLAQTYRLFHREYGESPGAMRRRLTLEFAGWSLVERPADPVWRIGLEAGFASAEGFARAFRRAYGVTPGAFRRAAGEPLLRAANAVHFWKGCVVRGIPRRGETMTPFTRLIEFNLGEVRAVLEACREVPAEELDRPLTPPIELNCYEGPEDTPREILHRMVRLFEIWLAAIKGRPYDFEAAEVQPDELIRRFDAAERECRHLCQEIEQEQRWNDFFIDALCTPPHSFEFGATFSHIVHATTIRRYEIQRWMAGLGVPVELRDPMEFSRAS